ncbi:putative phosphatidic acid phosphatase [Trypanosoma theileri]|uniref:Putative phosphatidic acid phosphatase n=1 Tax=Trypanosoma theileri TaxID=67003 RepID=A0A1X0P6S8_9TRYP|nr:putative phosphatidic acid phosphatase [Trypanosoma theileri]ORC92632.1 putative phosphatidic acid phosphatase [Trypanosoma theileri]
MFFDSTANTPFQRFLKIVYAFRLIDYLVCVVIGIAGWLIGRLVRPYCRPFSWNDTSIAYPYGGAGTFPSWTLAPIAILPCVVYVVMEVVSAVHSKSGASESFILSEDDINNNQVNTATSSDGTTRRRGQTGSRENVSAETEEAAVGDVVKQKRWYMVVEVANHWVLAQAFSVTLCLLVIDTTKLYAGRLRPDFLARLENEGYNSSSIDVDWCSLAREGRLSFPSGHSGIAFASIVPLVIYLLGILRALSGRSLWRGVVSLIPLILPITVAVSRTRDNRHHFSDILAGSVIGTCCAIFSVKCLFTFSNRKNIPLPSRLQYGSKKENWCPGRGTV